MATQCSRFAFTMHFTERFDTNLSHEEVLKVLKGIFIKRGGFQYEMAGELHAQGWGWVGKQHRIRDSTLGSRLNKEWKQYGWFKNIDISPESLNGSKKNALGRYCSKTDHTYLSGPFEWGLSDSDEYEYHFEDLDDYKLYGHALQMKEIIDKNKNNKRAVLWFADKFTNIGKSDFIRWFYKEHVLEGVCQLSMSEAERMSMGFYDWCLMNKKRPPRWLIIDIPKAKTMNKMQFAAAMGFLEQVKARFVRNNRYKGGGIRWGFNTTILVMANINAPRDDMGRDRFIEFNSIQIGPTDYKWI